jgi:hypothetical protein
MQSETTKAPFGYRLDESGNLAPEAKEQAVIQTIQSLRDKGLSLRAIAAELEAAGRVAKQAKALTAAMNIIFKWRDAGVAWNDIAIKLEEQACSPKTIDT